MPQMSSMDWLFLSMYFLFIYFMLLIYCYYVNNIFLKLNNNLKKNELFNLYKLIW